MHSTVRQKCIRALAFRWYGLLFYAQRKYKLSIQYDIANAYRQSNAEASRLVYRMEPDRKFTKQKQRNN